MVTGGVEEGKDGLIFFSSPVAYCILTKFRSMIRQAVISLLEAYIYKELGLGFLTSLH